MKKNPIYQALSAILRNTGTTLRILKYGLLENGQLRITDLAHELIVKFDGAVSKKSIVDINLLLKTGDMQAAIAAAQHMDINDFPIQMEYEASRPIPVQTLENLNDLLPAVLKDNSREPLQYIYINHKRKEAVATDGHLLLLKNIPVAGKRSFMIDPLSIKIISGLNPKAVAIYHRKEQKDGEGKNVIPAADFLKITGDSWQLITKTPDSYPGYWKILPDLSKRRTLLWDEDIKADVLRFIDSSLPFTNTKSHLVHFTATEGIVCNRDINCFRKTDFSHEVLPLQPEQVIGLNLEILRTVLKFIGDRPAYATVGETMIQGVVWSGDDFLVLQMPLRTSENSSGMTRTELLEEYGQEFRKAA